MSDQCPVYLNSLQGFSRDIDGGKKFPLVLELPGRNKQELDYHFSPSPDKGDPMTTEEEEALLRSDSQSSKHGAGETRSSSDTRSHAEVVMSQSPVGVVKPTSSPKQSSSARENMNLTGQLRS